MRKLSAALLLLSLSLLCSSCVLSVPGAGQSASSLGPDSVATSENTSTLPERMAASATSVWGWYNALKAKVDPAIEPMKKLYVAAQEMIVAVQAKDWLRALGYATTAWALVDQVKGLVK